MKLTNSLSTILWVSVVVSLLMLLPSDVSAAWGWGSGSDTAANEEVKEEVEIHNNNYATGEAADDGVASSPTVVINRRVASSPTIVNSRTLQSIIDKEQRFVLYNSRRLTGECLPICADDKVPPSKPTSKETASPTYLTKPPISAGQEGTLPPSSGNSAGSTEGGTGSPTLAASSGGSAGSTAGGTGSPTLAATKKVVDPGTFCRMENSVAWDSDSDCLGTPGSCQMRNPVNGDNSCGPGVPVGFYPDLTRCDAYCKCTGTEAPSEYMIVDTGLQWDTHQQGTNTYLEDVWGKNGAWGTNGGGQGWDWQMNAKGKERPPGTCGGPSCPDTKFHGCNKCTQFYNCATGEAGPLTKCGAGTFWDESTNTCNFSYAFECDDTNGNLPCP